MEIVGAVGPDHDESLAAHIAGQEGHEVACRAIRPMEILEDHDDRRSFPERAQQPEQALEDPGLDPVRACESSDVLPGRRPELRHQASELGGRWCPQRLEIELAERSGRQHRGQSPERFDERGERETTALAEAHAAAVEDDRAAGSSLSSDLVDQPGLADPGLTADEDDRRIAGAGGFDCRCHDGGLRIAADETRARDAASHALHGR